MNSSQLIPLLIGLALALPLAILLICGLALFAISVIAPRHRMILKMGLRNLARRRAQTLLIISGLDVVSALSAANTRVVSPSFAPPLSPSPAEPPWALPLAPLVGVDERQAVRDGDNLGEGLAVVEGAVATADHGG